MASRFYLPAATASDVSPAFSGSWGQTTSAVRRKLEASKTNGGAASGTSIAETSATPISVLLRQYVSAPIDAQTIDGTVKAQIQSRESNAANDMRAQMTIRVVSGDGATVRGTLLDIDDAASVTNEFSATADQNRKYPVNHNNNILSGVVAQAGDRIVVEVGYKAFNVAAGSTSGEAKFHDDPAIADLPEDETTAGVANGAPWIEFSDTIAMQVAATQVVAVTGSGL